MSLTYEKGFSTAQYNLSNWSYLYLNFISFKKMTLKNKEVAINVEENKCLHLKDLGDETAN